MKRLLLVRHGQSEMNTRQAHTIGGRSNASPLTSQGEQQVRLRHEPGGWACR